MAIPINNNKIFGPYICAIFYTYCYDHNFLLTQSLQGRVVNTRDQAFTWCLIYQ